MTGKLKQKAEELKISDFGIARARVFDDLCLDLRKKGFENAERMCNPFVYMEDAKSIIVCLFSYNTADRGNISKYAFGKDYHKVICEKLKSFSEPLENAGYKCAVYTDSWDFNERYAAVEAGLGFIGRNRLFISPKLGSFVFIGVVLTDCPLPPSVSTKKTCINCGKCVAACPGNALADGFDKNLCLSHITQKKGELSAFERDLIKKNGFVWGCDICQDVCPYNKNAPLSEIAEFSSDKITHLKIDADMSNREFRRKYSDRAFSWRGIAPLKRNIKIIEEK